MGHAGTSHAGWEAWVGGVMWGEGMAKATATNVRRTITLVMSEDEAEALQAVLAYVVGDERKSRRGLINGIISALYDLNVDDRTDDIDRTSAITFKDNGK